MERSFGFRFDFDDDSDGVSKTYSDELGETVGHGCGEETCSTLFGEVVEETGEGWGESEVEETGEEREKGRVSARCDATDRPNGFEASKPAMQSGSSGRLSRYYQLSRLPFSKTNSSLCTELLQLLSRVVERNRNRNVETHRSASSKTRTSISLTLTIPFPLPNRNSSTRPGVATTMEASVSRKRARS